MGMTLQLLYKDKAARVFAMEDNERFNDAFLAAATEVLIDLTNRCHVTPTLPTSKETDIGLSTKYLSVISAGLDLRLTERSEWSVDDPNKLALEYARLLLQASSIYFADNTTVTRHGTDLDD